MFFFTPRYLKQAKLLHKGVTRFINYKLDLLPQAKIQEIRGLRSSLEDAMKARDRKRIDELSEEINRVCNKALPEMKHSELGDNVEVFFVAIVVALGIRAYIAQPFKIPTGSMQPTLSGIIATQTEEDPTPNFASNWFQRIFQGRTYINAVSDHEGYLRNSEPITEHTRFFFFTFSRIHFEDGHTIDIPAPRDKLLSGLGLGSNLGVQYWQVGDSQGNVARTPDDQPIYHWDVARKKVEKGQLLARGILSTGDHVLVNKFAYNFRTPTRGEVFVFTTKHIIGIEKSGTYNPEHGSQHYIKRLTAVPGDHFEIRPPQLYINGEPAKEFGPQRVASQKDGYPGYVRVGRQSVYHLEMNQGDLGKGEYLAMGDNSTNSLDSRYWGPVPERNLVGPALFCYWPLTAHWGQIK